MPSVVVTGEKNVQEQPQPQQQESVQGFLKTRFNMDFEIRKDPSGNTIAEAKSVEYVQSRDKRTKAARFGTERVMGTYSPLTITIDPQGRIVKEVYRDVYKSDVTSKGYTQQVYEKKVTDYLSGTEVGYAERQMKSGRETIRKEYEIKKGQMKSYEIIHQTDKNYQPRTEEQRALIREGGYKAMRTEAYQKTLKGPETLTPQQLAQEKEALKRARLEQTFTLQRNLQEARKKAEDVRTIYKAKAISEYQKKRSNLELSSRTQVVSGGPILQYAKLEGSVTSAEKQGTPISQYSISVGGKPVEAAPVTFLDAPGLKQVKAGAQWVGSKVSQAQQKYEQEVPDKLDFMASRSRAQNKPVQGMLLSVGAYVTSIQPGVYKFYRSIAPWNIKETATGVVTAAKHPFLTGAQLKEEFMTSPAKFAGETTGQVLGSYGLAKGIQYVQKKSISPQIEKVSYEETYRSIGGQNDQVVDTTQMGAEVKAGNKMYKIEGYGQDVTKFSTVGAKDVRVIKGEQGVQIESPSGKTYPRSTTRVGLVDLKRGYTSVELVGKTYQGNVKANPNAPVLDRFAEKIKVNEMIEGSDELQTNAFTGRIYDVTGNKKITVTPESAYYGMSKKVFENQAIQTEGGTAPWFVQGWQTSVKGQSVSKELPFIKVTDPDLFFAYKQAGESFKPGTVSQPTPTTSQFQAQPPVVSAEVKNAPPMTTSGSFQGFVLKEVGKIAESEVDVPPTLGMSAIPTTSIMTSPQLSVKPSSEIYSATSTPQASEPFSSEISVPKSEPFNISLSGPKSVPQYSPIAVPKSTPQSLPKTVPQLVPQTIPQSIPQSVPQTIPKTVPKAVPQTIPELVPAPVPGVIPKGKEKRQGGAYEVSVRQKGMFRRIATTKTMQEAFDVGRTKVQHTAAASFKVKPLQGDESPSVAGRRFLPTNKFYESKKEAGVFIQKRGTRISTPGEKREITMKGIFSNKMKSARRGIFGGI